MIIHSFDYFCLVAFDTDYLIFETYLALLLPHSVCCQPDGELDEEELQPAVLKYLEEHSVEPGVVLQ